ncbi:transferase [Xylaria flabelliformis]|nr:transferase [Xylaria flabelliformis]
MEQEPGHQQSSSSIPRDHASPKTATLSPLDQLMPPCYTRIFFIFETQDQDNCLQTLSRGLGALCTWVPYITGHVFQAQDRKQFSIRWSTDHIITPVIQEIKAGAPMPSLAELQRSRAPIHHFQDSLAPVGWAQTTKEAPVFAASYSKLDGALLLCVCIHHNVMDGGGFAEFMRLWTLACRGEATTAVDAEEPLRRPARIRDALSTTSGETPNSSKNIIRPRSTCTSTSPLSTPTEPLAPGRSKIFSFPVAKLLQTRHAMEELEGLGNLTNNQVLNALIWSIITRVRMERIRTSRGASLAGESSRLGFAMNARSRLGEDFADGRFLGNVNVNGLAEISGSTLEEASRYNPTILPSEEKNRSRSLTSLAEVVSAVRSAVACVTKEYIAEVVSIVEQAPDVQTVALGWQIFSTLDLTLSSWANLPFYELDFGPGAGKPAFVRVPQVEADGLVIILPRNRVVDERIEALVALNDDDMDALEADEHWQQWQGDEPMNSSTGDRSSKI